MSAHGLYSNHLLPTSSTRTSRRLSSLTFYIMLLTHVEVATFIEFHPEFIRDSYALGASSTTFLSVHYGAY